MFPARGAIREEIEANLGLCFLEDDSRQAVVPDSRMRFPGMDRADRGWEPFSEGTSSRRINGRERPTQRSCAQQNSFNTHIERTCKDCDELQGMRFVAARDANRFWGGRAPHEDHVCRRGAGRSRSSPRQAAHGPGRPAAGPSAHRSQYRPQQGLCDECRQTFQLGAARQASYSQTAQCGGSRGVPAVTGRRDCATQAAPDRLPGRNGLTSPARKGFSRHPASRRIHRIAARAIRGCDRASFFHLARA